MNNEIGRKITSLTLMTIMLAGGMTIAAPGFMPEAEAANANLIVSAERFGGAMIVEVVIDDPNLDDDDVESMPNVTVDGKDLAMVQGSDGTWYGYFADGNMVKEADDKIANFGNTTSTASILGGFDGGAEVYVGAFEVLRNAKDHSPANNGLFGQVIEDGSESLWPFIQTWTFTDNKAIDVIYVTTPAQTESITYEKDMDDFASYTTDRTSYPHGADIHTVISDMQLNIDPTDEDIWTFDISGNQNSYYMENNFAIDSSLQNDLNYGDNGYLNIDKNGILETVSNEDTHVPLGLVASNVMTFVEDIPNSGIFENTDSGNDANLITTVDPVRDDSGIIDYGNERKSLLVEFFTGLVDMDEGSIDDQWSSGEEITVNITDQDKNTNTKENDDFDVQNDESIPTIEIGKPITLESTTLVEVSGTGDTSDLEDQRDALESQLSDVKGWVDTNQTEWDTIVSNKTAISDPLNANLTLWEGWLDGNSTQKDALILGGGSQTSIDDAQDGIDLSQLGLDQIQELIDDVYTDAELQVKDTLDGLLIDQSSLNDQIAALTASINSPSSDIPTDFTPRTFSKILAIDTSGVDLDDKPTFTISTNIDSSVLNSQDLDDGVHSLINYNFGSLNSTKITLSGETTGSYDLPSDEGLQSISDRIPDNFQGDLTITVESDEVVNDNTYNVIFDVFTFGQDEDGNRYNDAIYRMESKETSANSGTYTAKVEYVMLNQINIFKDTTFSVLETIGDELDIIVHEDLTDEDAVQVIYDDIDGQGGNTQVSDQTDAPTTSAKITFDADNYKVADTVTVTVEDYDLNTNSDLVDIYTVVSGHDTVSLEGFEDRSRLLDIEFDDTLWADTCNDASGLYESMSSLKETSNDSGIFTATFQIPARYCDNPADPTSSESVTGLDIKVNYVDFRDGSGEEIEVGDSAGVRASTGSVSLDRTVYPVPFGLPTEGASLETSPSGFPIHTTGIGNDPITAIGNHLDNGDLQIHVRVNDPDYDLSGSGADEIAEPGNNGPVKISVIRGSDSVVIGTGGAAQTGGSLITIGDTPDEGVTREFGPITEIASDAGIFELDVTIRYTDGPASSACPVSDADSLSHIEPSVGENGNDVADNHCILQGDILQVEYKDPTDASGDANTVTDSATFDLRNGVLQADKSVYIIGSDMILTLIEPDFDLDNDQAETYDLDLIEWDSDAATVTMGNANGDDVAAIFDPEPSAFRETGDSTGIFQIVVEIPEAIENNSLERGEEIQLEYTDWSPSGADYVGDEDEDVKLTIFTSNFGATVELDQKVYSWTDKVYITIVAPDHNFDGDLVDEIGNTSSDPLKVSTRGHDIDNYKLVETGTDTGIFTGEVILTGFAHDADGDGDDDANPRTSGSGPTDGFLESSNDDGFSVSFEFSEDESVLGSALIRWNIGEAQWLEASYPASGTGVVRIIDPDMNLDPEAVDNFDVDVWSDYDAGGVALTVTETNEATGIFEGTVFFTTTGDSSGHRLRVAEGDTVTAEYEDNTLPDPYTTADELDITATSLIGTVVPPLERAPAANLRTVDAFGNSLDTVSVDQQVQISADLANGQDREQTFAYLVQIQDGNGVTVSLAWITGSLSAGQSFSPALSWIPTEAGTYTATAFVWESVDNPTALSPPVSTTVTVQ